MTYTKGCYGVDNLRDNGKTTLLDNASDVMISHRLGCSADYLSDKEACLAATLYAERIGLANPNDAHVLRSVAPISYVVLKAGDETNVSMLPGFDEDGTDEVIHRTGSPQTIVPVMCGIDSNGNIAGYANCHYPATRRNVSIVETMNQPDFACVHYFEMEYPSNHAYDYVQSRYLYGGETILAQINGIEKFVSDGTNRISSPSGAIGLCVEPRLSDSFELLIETYSVIVISTCGVIMILPKERFWCGLYDVEWVPDTKMNRAIITMGTTLRERSIDSIDIVKDKIGLLDGWNEAGLSGIADVDSCEHCDAYDETLHVLGMIRNDRDDSLNKFLRGGVLHSD